MRSFTLSLRWLMLTVDVSQRRDGLAGHVQVPVSQSGTRHDGLASAVSLTVPRARLPRLRRSSCDRQHACRRQLFPLLLRQWPPFSRHRVAIRDAASAPTCLCLVHRSSTTLHHYAGRQLCSPRRTRNFARPFSAGPGRAVRFRFGTVRRPQPTRPAVTRRCRFPSCDPAPGPRLTAPVERHLPSLRLASPRFRLPQRHAFSRRRRTRCEPRSDREHPQSAHQPAKPRLSARLVSRYRRPVRLHRAW